MTRATIIGAALACADERGWEATSMQTVGQRAGVSNGSLFHHFPSRQALEAAVLDAGLADHQRALLATLRASAEARDGVVDLVAGHCRWLDGHSALARLFLTTPPRSLRGAAAGATVAASRAFFDEVGGWLRHHGWTGEPSLSVIVSLWIGPARSHSTSRACTSWASRFPHPPAEGQQSR